MDRLQEGPIGKNEDTENSTKSANELRGNTVASKLLAGEVAKLKGHKYVVLFSAFCVFAIIAGFFLCFGVLFVDILEFYHATRTETASVHSIFTAVELSSSLLIGFCVNKYGSRYCGVFGCFLASAGILLGSQCVTITQLQLCIGGISGLGFSLFFLSGIHIVSQCFDGASRISAMSVLLAAPSISGIAFPVVLRSILDVFGLKDTLLLLGAFCLNTIPLAYLWISSIHNKKISETIIAKAKSCDVSTNERGSSKPMKHKECTDTDTANAEVSHRLQTQRKAITQDINVPDKNKPDTGKVCESASNQIISLALVPSHRQKQHGHRISYKRSKQYGSLSCHTEHSLHYNELTYGANFDHYFDIGTTDFFSPNISFMYLPNIPTISLRSTINLKLTRELLTNVSYLGFAGAQLLTQTSLIVISMFTMDILADKDVSAVHASLVVLIFNTTGILGRLFPGLLKDTKNVRFSPFIPVLVATILGMSFILAIQLLSEFTVLVISFGATGFAHGCIVSSNSVTVVSLVRTELFTPAVGLIFGLLGICVAVAGPLNGQMRDSLGSYSTTLLLIQVSMVLGFILFVVAAVLHRQRKARFSRQINTSGA